MLILDSRLLLTYKNRLNLVDYFGRPVISFVCSLILRMSHMNALTGLKLVASKKNRTLSPVAHRRNKLVNKLHEQIELCEAQKAGQIYAPRRLRTVINKQTGERVTVEAVKRVKEWFWINDAGKINLAVRYGSKVLELAKGKNAVELGSGDELIAALHALKAAALAGELDVQIEAASGALRAGFVK